MKMAQRMGCVVLGGLVLAGGGCVSVKIGKPTVQTAIYKSETVGQGVAGVESAGGWASVEQEGTLLRVGLRGRAKVTERKADIIRELTVTKQKKMSFGILPGAAEGMFVGENGLYPLWGWDLFENEKAFKPYAGMARGVLRDGKGRIYARSPVNIEAFSGLAWTPVALFVTPFYGDWEPQTYHWHGGDHAKLDVAVFDKLNPEDRRRMRLNTCRTDVFKSYTTHFAFVGFHRFVTLGVEDRFVRNEPFTTERETGEIAVEGPYEVEVAIPAIGYHRRQPVTSGETGETFCLPGIGGGEWREAEAEIRFYAAGADGKRPDEGEKAILEATSGKTFKANVRLGGEAGMASGPE